MSTPGDLEQLVNLRIQLWPDTSPDEHMSEAQALLAGKPRSILPLAVFVAEEVGVLLGFAEVGLRSHANGCEPDRAVGFLEGWFVVPARQRQGIGKALLQAAEAWCIAQGCVEIASDSLLSNEPAKFAHEGVGFRVVATCVNYHKKLKST